jgi:hypothetical protein
MYDLPIYVWALALATAIGIPAATSVALYRGAIAAGLGGRVGAGVAGAAAVLLSGWIVVSGLLALSGAYRQALPPWLGVAVAGELIILLLATRIPVVSRILAAPGTVGRLALPHTFRIAGFAFLIVMMLGHLPAIFALPAGIGDIAVSVSAPFLARRLFRDPRQGGAVWFNVFGLLDLIVALGIGFLVNQPGIFNVTASAGALQLLPLALIPTTAIPLAVALHIVSLARLRGATRRVGAPAAAQHSPAG